MSIFGSVKAKRTLERTRLELYQDDDVLYVEMLNGASAFGILKNEDGEIISSFVTFGGEEEIKIPKDAVIIEITSNGVSYCGMLY